MRNSLAVRRVAVVGSGGSGKTTLARQLAERLDLPLICLDEHYWQPDWTATTATQWRARQRELIRGEEWIVDGNYSSTLDLRLSRADTVIIIALPRWRCMVRVLRRCLGHHGRPIQAKGCPERLDIAFLRWVWHYPAEGRARLDAALQRHARDCIRVIELRTPAQVRAFLATVNRIPADDPLSAGSPRRQTAEMSM